MVTEHARENVRKYLTPEHTNETRALAFSKAVNSLMGSPESCAIVLALDNPVANDYRDAWEPNDRLVGIVRGGDLVTVMLSREKQINKGHLRTNRVLFV